MTIDNELIDNLLKGYKKPEDLIGENGLLKQLTKRLPPGTSVASAGRSPASAAVAPCHVLERPPRDGEHRARPGG